MHPLNEISDERKLLFSKLGLAFVRKWREKARIIRSPRTRFDSVTNELLPAVDVEDL